MSGNSVVVVIGHVDHGKTRLVGALTGMQTDRLTEERERGISIALGFAHKAYSGGAVDFIDAPGHEDFVRTMAAGASGADAVLLVVSARDGIEAQTIEHLDIAGLLGLRRGVVAASKIDLVAPPERAAAVSAIKTALAASPLAAAPVIACSTETGEGLDALEDALAEMAGTVSATPALGGAYLPVDRVFNVTGSGAVVTGTLQGGAIREGDELTLAPSGRPVLARRLQIHGGAVSAAQPGRRVAVNLRGARARDIARGDVVCAPDLASSSVCIDGIASRSVRREGALAHMSNVRLHIGTAVATASVRLLEAPVAPGTDGLVQLRLDRPVAVHPGQRGILRRLSPSETLGGFIVLDPDAPPARKNDRVARAVATAIRSGAPSGILEALYRRCGRPVDMRRVARLARTPLDVALAQATGIETPAGWVPESAVDALQSAYTAAVSAFHKREPEALGAPRAALRSTVADAATRELVDIVEARLQERGDIIFEGGLVAQAGFDPFKAMSKQRRDHLARIESALEAGGASPPSVAELEAMAPDGAQLIGLLIRSGRAVSLRNQSLRQTLVFHRRAVEASYAALLRAFPFPKEFRTGEARRVLDTSRKFIVPLLEHYDACRLTIRRGDVRLMPPDRPDGRA